jgi:hypothetical protein
MATQTARKSSTSKSPAKRPTAKATAATAVRFNPEDLPQTGTVQFRHGGEYKPSIRALASFAKGNPVAMGHVKALVHLGWVKPGGVNNSSKSPAFTIADNAGLPAEAWTVGEPAGPQISANLRALAEAGAPEDALDGLWAAYVGV